MINLRPDRHPRVEATRVGLTYIPTYLVRPSGMAAHRLRIWCDGGKAGHHLVAVGVAPGTSSSHGPRPDQKRSWGWLRSVVLRREALREFLAMAIFQSTKQGTRSPCLTTRPPGFNTVLQVNVRACVLALVNVTAGLKCLDLLPLSSLVPGNGAGICSGVRDARGDVRRAGCCREGRSTLSRSRERQGEAGKGPNGACIEKVHNEAVWGCMVWPPF